MAVEINAEAEVNNLEDEMDLLYGTRNSEYNLRPRRPRDYSHLDSDFGTRMYDTVQLEKGA